MTRNKIFALILFICSYILIFFYVAVPKYREYKLSKVVDAPTVDEFDSLKFNLNIPSYLKLTKNSSQVYMIEDIDSVGKDNPFRTGIYIQKIFNPEIDLTKYAYRYCENINIPVDSVKEHCKGDIDKSLKSIKINNFKGVAFEYLHFEYYKHVVILLVGDKLFEFTLYGDVGGNLVPDQVETFNKIVSSFDLN